MEVNGVGSKVGLATIKMSGPQLFVIQFRILDFSPISYRVRGKQAVQFQLKYRNLFKKIRYLRNHDFQIGNSCNSFSTKHVVKGGVFRGWGGETGKAIAFLMAFTLQICHLSPISWISPSLQGNSPQPTYIL